MESNFDPMDHMILYAYRGSIAHNLYIPSEEPESTDDVDTIGVFIAPIDHYFGLPRKEHKEIKEGKDDIVVYDIIKFIRLLIKSNPNVMSLLWNDPTQIITVTPLGQRLIDNRQMFSSKAAFYSHMGYAKSQIKKMFSGSYQGYMGAKRKRVFDKYGYDTKNASHLIRLLRMGTEFLTTERLIVYREKDRNELIDIKQGKWSAEGIQTLANRLILELEEAHFQSTLPDKVDEVAINCLLVDIMKAHFEREQKTD